MEKIGLNQKVRIGEDDELYPRQVSSAIDVGLSGLGDDNVSVGSSRSRDPLSRYRKAKLKELMLRKELELKNQQLLLRARYEVELAKLDLESEQGEPENDPHLKESEEIPEDRLQFFLRDCAGRAEDSLPKATPNLPEATTRIDLPKVELQYFSGRPQEYWKFTR